MTACGTSEESTGETIQSYNNRIISYQNQAIDSLENYFSSLEKEYDGQNLSALYVKTRDELKNLHDLTASASGRKEDTLLRDAMASYISGLVLALETNERPVVELLWASYSGSTQQFYQQDRSIITQHTLNFSKALAQLDKELEEQQARFAQKYNFEIAQ